MARTICRTCLAPVAMRVGLYRIRIESSSDRPPADDTIDITSPAQDGFVGAVDEFLIPLVEDFRDFVTTCQFAGYIADFHAVPS